MQRLAELVTPRRVPVVDATQFGQPDKDVVRGDLQLRLLIAEIEQRGVVNLFRFLQRRCLTGYGQRPDDALRRIFSVSGPAAIMANGSSSVSSRKSNFMVIPLVRERAALSADRGQNSYLQRSCSTSIAQVGFLLATLNARVLHEFSFQTPRRIPGCGLAV